jgi:hypothetical protein
MHPRGVGGTQSSRLLARSSRGTCSLLTGLYLYYLYYLSGCADMLSASPCLRPPSIRCDDRLPAKQHVLAARALCSRSMSYLLLVLVAFWVCCLRVYRVCATAYPSRFLVLARQIARNRSSPPTRRVLCRTHGCTPARAMPGAPGGATVAAGGQPHHLGRNQLPSGAHLSTAPPPRTPLSSLSLLNPACTSISS